MADQYGNFSGGLHSPAAVVADVTPSDTVDLTAATRALNVATSGTVRVTTVRGSTATLYIAAGVAFPVRVTRVHASGTTATGITALI